jgi:hypothetical protein
MKYPNNIIAIDFDDTIVKDVFPMIGELRKDAKKIINKLYDEGYYIIIWTCRAGFNLVDMINFLNNNDIKYHKINENIDYEILGFKPSPKIFYSWIVDDKCIGGLPKWNEIYKIITGNELL